MRTAVDRSVTGRSAKQQTQAVCATLGRLVKCVAGAAEDVLHLVADQFLHGLAGRAQILARVELAGRQVQEG